MWEAKNVYINQSDIMNVVTLSDETVFEVLTSLIIIIHIQIMKFILRINNIYKICFVI